MAKQNRKYYDSHGRKLSLREYLDRGDTRAKQIVKMDAMLMTEEEISSELDVTQERVKQVLRKHRARRFTG